MQSAASQAYQQIEIERSLKGVKVKDVISTNIVSVPKDITIRELIDEWFLKYKYSKFPVVDTENDYKYMGVITLNDIKKVPRDKWDTVTAGEAVNIYVEEDKVEMDMELYEAIKKMNNNNISALVVVENGKIKGLLTKTDIMQFMRIKSQIKGR